MRIKCVFYIFLSLFIFTSCKRVPKGPIVKDGGTIVTAQAAKLTERQLGKTLSNAITVLPVESKDYLLSQLSKNPQLLSFFKENPRFVGTWEYLRKYLPDDCLRAEFLGMIKYANKYSSYGGNKLENFIYKKVKDGSIQVFSKDGQHLLATMKSGKIIEVTGWNVNNWFLQLKPFADAKYVINGAEYITDNSGRIIRSKVKLVPSNLDKEVYRDAKVQLQMAIQKGSSQGDDAGHIIANRFGGSSNMVNLVPMNKNINRSSYKQIENEWSRYLKNGKDVNVDIKLKYPAKPEGCERPDWIEVIYEVDGNTITKLIKNSI